MKIDRMLVGIGMLIVENEHDIVYMLNAMPAHTHLTMYVDHTSFVSRYLSDIIYLVHVPFP